MGMQREGFLVKVRLGTSDAPVGVGFVVGSKEIVTCAHVVNAALGREKGTCERPPAETRIQVEFPLLGDAEGAPLRNCRIAAWDPPPGAGRPGRDTAGLVLVGGDALPPSAGAARLVDARAGAANDAQVAVFGYPGKPSRRVNGAWSTCVLRGAVGGGLIQLDSGSESALRTQPGYSGAPVITTDRWGDAVIGMLAVASRDGAAEDAYAVPLSEVAAAWPEVLGHSVLPPCPYRGLQTFTAADAQAGVFVGREREVERLRNMVRAQPLVVVTGPSGVGKSSLVAAGLQPALAADGWAVASFRPGAAPYEAVARALLDLERPAGDYSLEQLDTRARSLREEGFWPVASRIALLTGRRLALIGDQFEEVISSDRNAEKPLEFLQHMLPPPDTLRNADVRLVCTLRADFLPNLLELPDVGLRLQDRQLNVSPLDEAALTRVIVEPAELSGVTFTPGLAKTIAREAGKAAGSLPLLEFALTELWPTQQQRRISFDSYHGLGGVSGALNRHAEKAYYILAQQVDERRIRRVLLSMVRARGGAGSAVRVAAQRSHLATDWYIAQLLAQPEQRLVTLGSNGPDTAEIAHEALIREWDRLAAWVDEDAEFQQWLAVMEERASDGDLLSATRVAEAQGWLEERSADIPQQVASLIENSRSAVLEQQRTKLLLSESQELAKQLQVSNAELEEKAELLATLNRDIEVKNSEIEQARQALEERAEQLAVSMRYTSEFVANISHELRTPLNSLLILAKLLSANAEGNLSERQIQFAETIHGAGSDLLQLINDILDLSMVEAGKMDVLPTPIALVQLVDYVEATFRPLTDEKGLDFSVKVSPDLPAMLHTDEQRLLQVLRNLLSNAVKFTDSGSVKLLIRPARSDMPSAIREHLLEMGSLSDADAELIAFCVKDTGIGIAASQMKVIFQAFRQGDTTISRKYGGTGLGLSIARDIAHLLGGEIHPDSEPDHGSTFTLYLPLAPDWAPPDPGEPADASPQFLIPSSAAATQTLTTRENGGPPTVQDAQLPPTLLACQFKGERVLLIDDDIRTVFALASVLEQHGLDVMYAENGREGIEVLERRDDVTAILVDIAMPEMDGYATTAAIRRMPQFAGLPIIALSAKAMEGDREKAIESGASDYITKPIDTDQLLRVMERWIRRT